MSEKNPECPLYNPLNCKEYYNPKLCAFAREDKVCLKKIKQTQKQKKRIDSEDEATASPSDKGRPPN